MATIIETDKVNLKCDPVTNDLVSINGQLQLSSGIEGVVQAVKQRLQLFKGEWLFDLEAGMPYFQEIFIKNPYFSGIQQTVTDIIGSTPGINETSNVTSVDLNVNSSTRTLYITWRAISEFGPTAGTVASII